VAWATYLRYLPILCFCDFLFSTYVRTWPPHHDLWFWRLWRLFLIPVAYLRSIHLARLKFVGLPIRQIWCTSTLSISRPSDLDLSPFDLEGIVCIIARRVSYQFCGFWNFSFLTNGPTSPCNLDLDSHGAYRWYGVRALPVPSLNFLRFPIWKIWQAFGLSINHPSDLDLWPFDLETGALYCTWGAQSCYQFWCFWDLSSNRIIGANRLLSDGPHDFATLTLKVRHLCSTECDVCRPSRSEDMSDTLSVTELIVLVTFTVDLLTSN